MTSRDNTLMRRLARVQPPLWIRSIAAVVFLALTALVSGCIPGGALDALDQTDDLLLTRVPASAAESPVLLLSTKTAGENPTFRPLSANAPVAGAHSGAVWTSVTYPSGTGEVTDSRAFLAFPGAQSLWAVPTDGFAQPGLASAAVAASSPVQAEVSGNTIYTLGASSILAHNSITLAPEPSIPLPGAAITFDADDLWNLWVLRSGSVLRVSTLERKVVLEKPLAGTFRFITADNLGGKVIVAGGNRIVALDVVTLSQVAATTTTATITGIVAFGLGPVTSIFVALGDRVVSYVLFGDSLSQSTLADSTALVTNAGPTPPQLQMLNLGKSSLYGYNRTDGTVWAWEVLGMVKQFQSKPVPNAVSLSVRHDFHLDKTPALPITVPVTAATAPPGLTVTLNGRTGPAPVTVDVLTTGFVTLTAEANQSGKPGERFQFLRWSSGANLTQTFPAPSNPTTYTATYVTQYQLTLDSDTATCPAAVASPAAQTGGWYDSGASVVLTLPTLSAGCSFKAFAGDLDASVTGNTATIKMDKPRKITAGYGSSGTHTVTTSPVGLKVDIDGTVGRSPVTVNWPPGSRHTMSGLTTQSDIDLLHQDTEYTFANWSYTGSPTNPYLSPTGPTTNPILVESPGTPTTFTANFSITGYRMRFTLFSRGGGQPTGCSTTLTPPIPASGFYPPNTSVTFQTTTTNGWTFVSYSGSVLSTDPKLTVVMDKGYNMTGLCAPPANGNVTVTTAPAGLQVNVDGTVSTAPVTANWVSGSNHTLTAITPQVLNDNTQYTFANWTPGALPTTIITPSAPADPTTYMANYNVSGYRMAFTLQAAGGGAATGCSATLNPPLPASGFYAPGTSVGISVTAENLWTFGSFSGTISTTTNQQVTVAMNQPHTIVATCNPPTSAQVTFTSTPVTGIPITIDGAASNSPRAVSWAIPSNHTVSAPATVDLAGTRYTFQNWSNGQTTPAISIASYSGTPGSFTANYTATAYQLCLTTQTVSGHTPVAVTVAPLGTQPGGGCTWYNANTSVTLTVDSTIASLKPTIATGTSTVQGSTATFPMDRLRNASVTYTLDPAPALTQTIALSGAGTRTVTVTLLNSGASEILTAAPDFTLNSNYEVLGVTLTTRGYLPGQSAIGITAQVRRKSLGIEDLVLNVTTAYRDILGGSRTAQTTYTDPIGN